MNRRHFLRSASRDLLVSTSTFSFMTTHFVQAWGSEDRGPGLEPGQRDDWLARWQKRILGELSNRYCDKETGEELGWLVSPFLNGYYYGYLATREQAWVERLVDWADACFKRAVKQPDGFIGWPKGDGGGHSSEEYQADSLLGEAMLLRPVVLMADRIRKTPELKATWGAKAESYLETAERFFQKWDQRDCWREVKEGGLWVVPAYGLKAQNTEWSDGYKTRKSTGFSNPNNKQNHIARWLLAMFDATGKTIYRERAEQWFRLMKSRLKTQADGRYLVWNYWEPAGPWDFKPDGSPKHWVGVHPNGGYYGIDVEGMVSAYEHGLVFTREDLDRLIATNRDFMWNQQLKGVKFQRIDGAAVDPRWKNSPGVLWTSLVPYDKTLKQIFLASHDAGSWGGLSSTPWFLSLG